jgi:hypothetical protein
MEEINMMDINITKKDGTNKTVKMPNTIGYAIGYSAIMAAYGTVLGLGFGLVKDVIGVFKKK